MTHAGRLRPLARHAGRLAGVYGACLTAAAVLSWPLLRTASGHLPGPWPHPDITTAVWFRWHLVQRLAAGESPLFAPGLYHPDGMDVTLHIWNLGVSFAQAPFAAVFGPLTGFNVSLLFLAAFNGLAGYVLGRTVGGGRLAGVVAAAVLLASNFAWAEMIHGRCEQGLLAFVALAVAGLVQLRRGAGGAGMAVATGLGVAAAGLCFWFYAAFLGFLMGGLAVVSLLRRDWRGLGWLGLACAVAAVILVPAAIPVLVRMAADSSPYARTVADGAEVASLVDGLRRQYSVTLLGSALWPTAAFPQRVCIGLPLLGLVAWAAALAVRSARARAGFLPWMALGGVILAAGPMLLLRPEEPLVIGGRVLPMPGALLDALPLFERQWWPHRWLSLSVVGGAGCAAAAMAALPRGGRLAGGVALGFVLLFAVEARLMFHGAPYAAFAGDPQPLGVPAYLERLAAEPGQHPLLQLPLRRVDDAALIYVPFHRQPVDGGPAYTVDVHAEPAYLRRIAASPALTALDRLARNQDPPPVADVRRSLRELGFRHAVFWRDQDVFGRDWTAIYSQFFDVEPAFADAAVVIWEL